MKPYLFLLAVVCCMATNIVTVPAQDDPCLHKVRTAMATISTLLDKPKQGRCATATLDIRLHPRVARKNSDADVQDKDNMHIVLQSTGTKSYMQYGDIAIVQDEHEVFSIYPRSRLIVRSPVADDAKRKGIMSDMKILHDSVLRYCRVVACSYDVIKRVDIIRLEPVTTGKVRLPFKAVEINIDPIRQVPTYVNLIQRAGEEYSRIEILYTSIVDNAVIPKELQKKAENIVFDDKGKRRPEYASYELRGLK